MAQDIISAALAAMSTENANENETRFAPTKGLGFNKYDGNTPIKDIIHEIGANFTVRKDPLIRVPSEILYKIQNGESVIIDPKYLIDTHACTVREQDDKTIGVVGKDYGVIQNDCGVQILDLLTNSTVTGTQMSVVSAGMVHEFEPYFQVKMGDGCRLDGDNSDTEFYAFFHNSHDGGSSMQLTFSTIRVVCRNTFMMNCNLAKTQGLVFKHTKYVTERLAAAEVIEKVKALNILKEDYIAKMNAFRLARITDKDIDRYVANLFFGNDLLELAKSYGYDFKQLEALPTSSTDAKENHTVAYSTRMRNIVGSFRDTLESGVGQDTNRGTKKWFFDGVTNYYSNVANYGSDKDLDIERATKRFDALMGGTARKNANEVYAMLAA